MDDDKMAKEKGKSIEIIEETVEIQKEKYLNEKIEVVKSVREETLTENLDLVKEDFSIDHIEINKEISEIPKIRNEGNVTIIPVTEEVAVVTKKLILIKEIHITRNSTIETKEINVSLNKEEVAINREEFKSPK